MVFTTMLYCPQDINDLKLHVRLCYEDEDLSVCEELKAACEIICNMRFQYDPKELGYKCNFFTRINIVSKKHGDKNFKFAVSVVDGQDVLIAGPCFTDPIKVKSKKRGKKGKTTNQEETKKIYDERVMRLQRQRLLQVHRNKRPHDDVHLHQEITSLKQKIQDLEKQVAGLKQEVVLLKMTKFDLPPVSGNFDD